MNQRVIGWLALGPGHRGRSLLIVPTQRPRPEYLYGLSLPIVAAAAWAADTLIRRWGLADALRLCMPAAILVSFPAYGTYYVPPPGKAPSRPLLETVRRLEPYADRISAPGAVFLAGEHSFSLGGYLVRPRVDPRPRVLGNETFSQLGEGEPVEAFLERFAVTLVYLDEGVGLEAPLESRSTGPSWTASGTNGWRTLASRIEAAGAWLRVAAPGPCSVTGLRRLKPRLGLSSSGLDRVRSGRKPPERCGTGRVETNSGLLRDTASFWDAVSSRRSDVVRALYARYPLVPRSYIDRHFSRFHE